MVVVVLMVMEKVPMSMYENIIADYSRQCMQNDNHDECYLR